MADGKVITVMCAARLPELLVARIDAAAKSGGVSRAQFIAEACRMRLDGVAGIDKSAVSKGTTGSQTLDTGTNVKSPAEAKEPQTPPKPNMQALRDTCAGKVDVVTVAEIPLCLKTWWNNDPTLGDGEQYECHLDKGHRGNCNKGRML